MKTTPDVTTYSQWNAFRNCRKLCQWRYLEHLVPLERDQALSFGSLIHQCLELWHGGAGLPKVQDLINMETPDRYVDDKQKQTWHLAHAMMQGYAARYPSETWDVVDLEREFSAPIINPRTNRPSRVLRIAGKVDGVIKLGSEYYLLEHKTASAVDANYLDKLWSDMQISLYSYYAEQCWGIQISGVIYNILVKARLVQGKGETQEEFEARRDALLAASKTGKSSATRKMPEGEQDYRNRLHAKYADPEMFHRQVLYIGREQIQAMREDLWELTQLFLDAKRRRKFLRNTSYCFNYNRACSYLPLCQANGNAELLVENMFEIRPPHEELANNGNDIDQEVF